MLVSQNDSCPCGSGKIFKNCCLPKMMMMGKAKQEPHQKRRPAGIKREDKKEEVFTPDREEIMNATPQERLNIADKLITLNKEDEAMEILETILQKKEGDLSFIDLFFKVIDYYKRTGNYDRAILFCNELIKYDEENSGKFSDENLRLKAELLISSGKNDEGIKIFLELIEKKPDDLWNYYGIANALLENKMIEEAIKYMEKGLALQVNDIDKVKVFTEKDAGEGKNE